MPLLNGEEATRKVLELCYINKVAPIPIYGCTGFSSKEDIEFLL